MGASPLFPLFIAMFFLGVAALNRNHNDMVRSQTTIAASSVLEAGTFLNYRSVVTAYTQAHSGWTGTVPSAYLSAQGITTQVQGQITHQVVSSATGRQVVVFANMAGKGFEVYRQEEGDGSIGLMVNGQFQPFDQGAPAALPIAVSNGNVVSFVEVGN